MNLRYLNSFIKIIDEIRKYIRIAKNFSGDETNIKKKENYIKKIKKLYWNSMSYMRANITLIAGLLLNEWKKIQSHGIVVIKIWIEIFMDCKMHSYYHIDYTNLKRYQLCSSPFIVCSIWREGETDTYEGKWWRRGNKKLSDLTTEELVEILLRLSIYVYIYFRVFHKDVMHSTKLIQKYVKSAVYNKLFISKHKKDFKTVNPSVLCENDLSSKIEHWRYRITKKISLK